MVNFIIYGVFELKHNNYNTFRDIAILAHLDIFTALIISLREKTFKQNFNLLASKTCSQSFNSIAILKIGEKNIYLNLKSHKKSLEIKFVGHKKLISLTKFQHYRSENKVDELYLLKMTK